MWEKRSFYTLLPQNGSILEMSNEDYSKIRKQIKSKKYKLLLDLAWYTGERWGAGSAAAP